MATVRRGRRVQDQAPHPPILDARPEPAHAEWFVAEGQKLAALLFDEGAAWCQRRVLMLDFLDERRGEWSVNVDFNVPSVSGMTLLEQPNGLADTSPDYLLPLLTFPKDFLPAAHITTLDEEGRHLSLADSGRSRLVAFAILLAYAAAANVPLQDRDTWDRLWGVTSPDTVVASKSCFSLADGPITPDLADGADHDAITAFFKIVQLLTRSVYLLLEFPNGSLGQRKIVSFSHDGPLRITRTKRELLGIRPLSIAPRCSFGGNAKSFHVQMSSPERLTVVDSRLLYTYYSEGPHERGDDAASEPDDRRPADQLLRDAGSVKGDTGPIGRLGELGLQQWWGQVEGPAEPMSAHVRCSGSRMPGLQEAREVFAVFQLYPQFAGQLTLFFIAAAANLGFAWALFAGILWGRPFKGHHGGFLGFNGLAYEHPEAILIMTVLVVGFGVGLIIYPKEHLITSGVLRPWRWVEGLIIALSLAVAMTSLWGWDSGRTHLWPNFDALVIEIVLDTAAFIYLTVIIIRPWLAEPEGVHGWRHTGLRIRRIGYPIDYEHEWHGRVLDDYELAERELGPRAAQWQARIAELQDKKLDLIRRDFAEVLLVPSSSRKLFNRGIPPAIRHDRTERGY